MKSITMRKMRYRPHTFDTQGFFVGVKCLLVLAIVLVGLRYGTVFASGMRAQGENAMATAQTAAILPTMDETIRATTTEPHKPNVHTTGRAPTVTAKAYLVADLDTGATYAERDADTPYPIASISKLLVALAARETLSPETHITITKADRRETEGSPGSILRDETFSVADLFYPLLMESNNSAAYALERTGGGDEFVRVMLRIAHSVGMDETLLNDSSGLSAQNDASARDLASLARYIAQNAPDLFAITRTKSKAVTAASGRTYAVANLNVYASDPTFVGGKTGYTDAARQTMLTVFQLPVKKAEKPSRVVIIVLASSDRKNDINKLKAWFERSAAFE